MPCSDLALCSLEQLERLAETDNVVWKWKEQKPHSDLQKALHCSAQSDLQGHQDFPMLTESKKSAPRRVTQTALPHFAGNDFAARERKFLYVDVAGYARSPMYRRKRNDGL